MSVSRLSHITPIGVEQMGDLANSLKDPECCGWKILTPTCARPTAPWNLPKGHRR